VCESRSEQGRGTVPVAPVRRRPVLGESDHALQLLLSPSGRVVVGVAREPLRSVPRPHGRVSTAALDLWRQCGVIASPDASPVLARSCTA
jgi:hypothetical protein